MHKLFFLLLFPLCLSQISYGQKDFLCLPEIKISTIESKYVMGQTYELQVSLPMNYNEFNEYPVVYSLDAQWDFTLLKAIYGEQYYDGFLPECILVGIKHAGEKANYDSLRVRDFTPTKGNTLNGGQADKFLDFLAYEAFPFIEGTYHGETSNRTLAGSSLGGLFALYTLFTKPHLFTNYIAPSPSIMWDNYSLKKFEDTFYLIDGNGVERVYITVGDQELSKNDIEKFIQDLKDRRYFSIKLEHKTLENTGHSGTKAESYARGLQYVLSKPEMKIHLSDIKDKLGKYYASDKNSVELKFLDDKLFLNHQGIDYPLTATSEKSFYSKAKFLKLNFFSNMAGFKLDTFGKSMLYKM